MNNIKRADLVQSILALGSEITFIVEGHIGSSKSALAHDIAQALPTHRMVYIDMASIADTGDFQIPAINHDTRTSAFYPNESLGVHTDQPMILVFDEIGKTSQSVLNAILPALNERRWGNTQFHPDTIVFATTNMGAENVGDILKPHVRNRITMVRMDKPTAEETVIYGVNHGMHPIVAAWISRNPQCFESFENVEHPDDNMYIYHPKAHRPAFVTHRSMARASTIMHKRDTLGYDATTHILAGTIGAPAAYDLMTFATLADKLPTRGEIIDRPLSAQVPDSPAAMVLLVCQAVHWVDESTFNAWVTYMNRFPINEPKALFMLQITNHKEKVLWASRDQAYTDFVRKNAHLFGA